MDELNVCVLFGNWGAVVLMRNTGRNSLPVAVMLWHVVAMDL
jgi:hypothetical protein